MEQKIEVIIAQNLIELRKSRNLKQSDLSEAIGYSDKTISRWENGTSIPDISTLVKLSEFYNIPLNDLIKENALEKSLEDPNQKNEKLAKDFSNLGFIVFTIWLISGLIYVGLIMVQRPALWQVFVLAVSISSYFVFRVIRKNYNIKWLNFLFLSLGVCCLVTAIYLLLLEYNFWQLFFLIIPLEGICAVNTFIQKKNTKKDKNKKK